MVERRDRLIDIMQDAAKGETKASLRVRIAELEAALADAKAELARMRSLVKQAQHDVPKAYVNWHSAARTALAGSGSGGWRVPEGGVQITLSDAKIIKDVLEEFYLKQELSPDEERAFLTLCTRGGFGRPVRLTAAQEGR